MSEDEVFALVASCVLAGIFWIRWYRHCQAVTWLRCGLGLRLAVIAVPVACGVLLWIVLRRLASHDVREAPQYLALYFAMGAAWVGLGVRLLGLLGLSVRDDALERRNGAAAWAAAGGLIGLTLCFAGGNIGDGPGWWVVVYSALLSTGGLLLLWAILDRLTGVSESVTVERDVASGMRLGGFLAAAGLILGRAVAGNWVSAMATNAEFLRAAWPVLVLLMLAVPCEWLCRPSVEQPQPPWFLCGLPPLVIYVGGAVLWLAQLGLAP
ncbi:MAG: hypothetical protein MUF25_25265 [Pirellulaceae bacterium]|jgi:hypothetical protein|nr:hypothetical protein [Pirellulaceae bacterium]